MRRPRAAGTKILTKVRHVFELVDDAAALREFNRFYTQAIGVLTDHYLSIPHPLRLASACKPTLPN
jgi:hypothetical protein